MAPGPIQIYDTLTATKRVLNPLQPGYVRMYVCGITVYDYCHIGHARMLVAFDVIVRHLRARGFRVLHVRNITDIDDKIIKRAAENGESIPELTERFITAMRADADALGVERPDLEPRATEHVPDIIALVERLLARGHAYCAANGDVYYAVHSFPGYGKLSGKRIDELRAGARVEIGEDKRDPLDFVLWKAAKPGEPAWDSPWGPGRPGWHIECSAMSMRCLGNHFDLHGGGLDLQFPHHENEIAQSEGATGEPFVEHWLHNGFVRIDEQKMSKSLGNFFTIRDVLARFRAEELRYLLVASHYRSPLNYSDEALANARASLTRLYTALRGVAPSVMNPLAGPYLERYDAAMNDDFNTAEAVAVLFDIAREINRSRTHGGAGVAELAATLRGLGARLGLLGEDPEHYLRAGDPRDTAADAEIERLIAARAAARARKDWPEADRVRAELDQLGILLEDSRNGTIWRRR